MTLVTTWFGRGLRHANGMPRAWPPGRASPRRGTRCGIHETRGACAGRFACGRGQFGPAATAREPRSGQSLATVDAVWLVRCRCRSAAGRAGSGGLPIRRATRIARRARRKPGRRVISLRTNRSLPAVHRSRCSSRCALTGVPPRDTLAQLQQRLAHPGLDGAERRVHPLGDLGLRQALEAGQHHHRALRGREPAHGGRDVTLERPARVSPRGVGRGRRWGGRDLDRHGGPRSGGPARPLRSGRGIGPMDARPCELPPEAQRASDTDSRAVACSSWMPISSLAIGNCAPASSSTPGPANQRTMGEA